MGFVLSLIVLALMAFALVDIIRRDDAQVKYMPKFVWMLLVVLLPFIGSMLWFGIGREYPEGGLQIRRPSHPERSRPPAAPPAPVIPVDTRTTEQQIADLDREIEEWRLREEIEKRRREREDPSTGSGTQE
ncbi:PLD nuclease N-terminal domain-containing protein [Microbacterium sp. YJN-G]|uniref:PLD nuclease N-terminal domain-containing protein n=1 Tax=Microbacterium sp. YJN-G TaxID=2763257 RepID=UPI001877D742|nr:PLD nuclease N-terminal domain-containing protein [Microbacterium sp. YJN-G]